MIMVSVSTVTSEGFQVCCGRGEGGSTTNELFLFLLSGVSLLDDICFRGIWWVCSS